MKKMPQYDVIVSDRAQHMLGIHVRFLAGASPSAARRVKVEIMKVIRSLSTMPQRFSFLNEEYIPSNKYHKVFVENNYLVLYQIKNQTVYVDYIVDTQQDYSWLIK